MEEEAVNNLKSISKSKYIEEHSESIYKARELYDRRKSLNKTNFALRRLLKNPVNKESVKTILEYKAIYLIKTNNTQIALIKSTPPIDETSDSKETVFTGIKAVWYDKPFRELIYKYYHHDINDFYTTVNKMGNEIKTEFGNVPKNLALQFIQNLRLIVSDGSAERYNRGIFKIHHDLQIAPTHVVIILEALGISCRPQCVMKKSESEYERGEAPDWLISLANKPYTKPIYKEEELTEEEKELFARINNVKNELIVIEGGCKCNHNKSDHYGSGCSIRGCDCTKFIKRMWTKKIVEV